MDNKKHLLRLSSSLSSSSSFPESEDELMQKPLASPRLKYKKRLSKQFSMCETRRELAWEKKRRQKLRPRNGTTDKEEVTKEDWNELKACIELGFAFTEEHGRKLCGTLPALDVYFAINRQLSSSPVSSMPQSSTSTSSLDGRSSSIQNTPKTDSDTWRVCSPGDDPEKVRAKLRHWAQAVACSVMQSMVEK